MLPGTHAVRMAVRAYVEPNTTRNLATGPIPSHVIDILKIAAQSEDVLEQWSQELNMPRRRLVDIAVFFIEQVMMTREATYYRVLGVNPGAPQTRLRNHYQWLMRWLHPDGPRADWHAVMAQRVTEAYNVLKDANRRAAYDDTLHLPGTTHLRSTVPVLTNVVDEDDLEHMQTVVLPETAADHLHAAQRNAAPELPTLTDRVTPPAPSHQPVEVPPPVWVPERIAATGRWKQPAPPRSMLRYIAVAGVLLAAIVALGWWLKAGRPVHRAAPAAAAGTAVAPPPPATSPAGPANQAPTATPEAPAAAPRAPSALPAPAAAVAQSSAPSPGTTPPAAPSTGPAPAVTPARAKARPSAPPPVITETPPKPRRAAPPAAGTAPNAAPAAERTTPAPPAAPPTTRPTPAPTPATLSLDPAARAIAGQVGHAYASGDFLTVLNLLNGGGRASSPDLAASAKAVQDWSRERGGQALAVAGARTLPPAAGGAEPREEIVLRAADGARLRMVLRQVGDYWQVERITPDVAAPAAGPGR